MQQCGNEDVFTIKAEASFIMNFCPQGGVGCFLFWIDVGSKEYKGIERES